MQRFGVNRLTVRKGVRVLADEGLVEAVPRRGVFVAERQGGSQLARQVA